MAYKINDGCVGCGACAGACPVGAISEADGVFVIDADSCIEWWSMHRCLPNRINRIRRLI